MRAEVGRQPGEGLCGLLMLLVLVLLRLMMMVLGGHFAPEVHSVTMSRRYQIGLRRRGEGGRGEDTKSEFELGIGETIEREDINKREIRSD